MSKTIDEKVRDFAKPGSSSIKSKEKVINVITAADVIELDRSIEPKIRQNALERKASYEEARRTIVKD